MSRKSAPTLSPANVAASVKYLRKAAKLTQGELARMAGISDRALAIVEAGTARRFGSGVVTVDAIARALGTTVDGLMLSVE